MEYGDGDDDDEFKYEQKVGIFISSEWLV